MERIYVSLQFMLVPSVCLLASLIKCVNLHWEGLCDDCVIKQAQQTVNSHQYGNPLWSLIHKARVEKVRIFTRMSQESAHKGPPGVCEVHVVNCPCP